MFLLWDQGFQWQQSMKNSNISVQRNQNNTSDYAHMEQIMPQA